jgi:hypothetical protein
MTLAMSDANEEVRKLGVAMVHRSCEVEFWQMMFFLLVYFGRQSCIPQY